MVLRQHIFVILNIVLLLIGFIFGVSYISFPRYGITHDLDGYNPEMWSLIESKSIWVDGVEISLSAYILDTSKIDLNRVINDILEYCINLEKSFNASNIINSTSTSLEELGLKCRVSVDKIMEYIDEDRIAVIAIVGSIHNRGIKNITFGGPGPYCGYSYNLMNLFDESQPVIYDHYKPPGYLSYRISDGELILGYSGVCEEALILHHLQPGEKESIIYGFIAVKPVKLSITFEAGYGIQGEQDNNVTLTLELE